MDDATMRDRVHRASVGRLATVTGGGLPHVVPCCFVVRGDVIHSAVDAKPKSTLALRRLDNLRANPSASLLVDRYDDEWSALWWIRMDGRARIIGSGEEFDRALVQLAAKYPQYRHAPPPGPVIAIDVTTWRAWP